jgi:riboflavin synthase
VFTGIVEALGSVESVQSSSDGSTLTLRCPVFGSESPIGSSIAVNGVCLTVTSTGRDRFTVDVVPETLARTNLGGLSEGSTVNLERAMPASGRFDGHVVQGHVDGIGTVSAVLAEGSGKRITIETTSQLMRYIVEKGSITVDGVSLTVAGVAEGAFEIALIPHTIDVTTFAELSPGSTVNLEVDILAKYVERLMEYGR